jgi:DNA-directed RNA polymerase specialized sigma24 family protein
MEAHMRMAQAERTDVLSSARAGDAIAFGRIVDAHHEDMRRVCAYVAGDLSFADAATQAAWVIAWRRLRDVHLAAVLLRI